VSRQLSLFNILADALLFTLSASYSMFAGKISSPTIKLFSLFGLFKIQ